METTVPRYTHLIPFPLIPVPLPPRDEILPVGGDPRDPTKENYIENNLIIQTTILTPKKNATLLEGYIFSLLMFQMPSVP